MPQISVIIPLFNEEESLPELFSWIERVMKENNFTYEIICVDDGSKDNSWQVIQENCNRNDCIKGIKFQRNYGKSPALNEGFKAAKGDVIITMDADLQDSPDEIPELYNMIVKDGFDVVSGWKKKRYDNALTKNIPSKLYNTVTGKMSGVKLHDMNCGLKSYSNRVIKSVEVYGEMHRYIPVLAKWAGFTKIGEKTVQHQARKYGTSKFGWERFIYGFLDLLSLMFVGKFGKKPMHLFGSLGVLSFMFGLIMFGYLTFQKFAFQEYFMTQRPLFYVALALMMIGTQFFLAGFLGELISRTSHDRNLYLIDKKVGL